MPTQHVIIVGGGVIGTACAYYLQQAGCRVTILEKGKFAGACSHGNCGLITPSHVLPLNTPGAVWKTMKAMLSPNSPFAIKLQFNWTFLSWMLNFTRRCNAKAMLETAVARDALLKSTAKLYEELLANESLDCEYERKGVLFVYRTQAGFDHYRETNQLLTEKFNVPATPYEGASLNELEPALKEGLAGAWHYEMDAHLRPDKLMISWRKRLEEQGVTIREQADVTGFERRNGGAVGVKLGDETLEADQFVVASGAVTPFLNKHLGCNIPIQPGKGYSLTMPRPAVCPGIPMIFQEDKVAVTPMQSGYRLGSTMEFAGYDTSINRKRLGLLSRGAEIYLKDPHTTPIEEEWYGWRPMTYDGRPIIDRSPLMDNVWIAAGHNMIGLTLAPATGKLISELVTQSEPHLDIKPYSLTRFQ